MKFKTAIGFFAVIIVLAVLAGGAVYLSIYYRQKQAVQKLTLAEALLAKQDYERATKQLEELHTKYGKMAFDPKVTSLLAETCFQQGNYEDARKYSDEVLGKYPASAYVAKAMYIKGKSLIEGGQDVEEARTLFKQLVSRYPDDEAADRAMYGLAELARKRGNLVEAKQYLDKILETRPNSPIRNEAEMLLGEVNMKILLSRQTVDGDTIHTVQEGDSIYKLARQYNVTQELLLECNQINDPRLLAPGQRLKIPRCDFSIVVDKSDNTLTLYSGDKFFKKYRVRTGKYNDQTPVGEYVIENKKKDPEWVNPRDRKRYPAGHPENELGTRWMSFYQDRLGIHGTIHPETIGQYASYGCVGMLKQDVEELYDIVPLKTPVKIIGETKLEGQS
jgi:outer membrane protein assembly factor BamD (BamD/ComL family)